MMVRIATLIFTLALGILAASLPADAQQRAKLSRIGFLGAVSASSYATYLEALRQGLREHGYVEGHNILIEYRWAEGRYDRLPELAAELVRLKVDVIVAPTTLAARAAKKVTQTTPVIFATAADPVGAGLVSSLARPGGNVTGLSSLAGREIEGRRLSLLKEAVPTVSRVAVVLDSTSRLDPRPLQAAAKALPLTLLLSVETESPAEFETAFATMVRERADAVYAPETPANSRHRTLIVKLAEKYRLPAIYGSRESVEAGGLMSYGTSLRELFHRAAVYVDKIFRGAKPDDLPVEQPMKFEFVINMKTARTLGLTVPRSVLMQADEVLQEGAAK